MLNKKKGLFRFIHILKREAIYTKVRIIQKQSAIYIKKVNASNHKKSSKQYKYHGCPVKRTKISKRQISSKNAINIIVIGSNELGLPVTFPKC